MRELIWVVVGIVIIIVAVAIFMPQSCRRSIKTFSSGILGLERKLEVFDYNGNLIRTYEGRFDIQTDSAGKLLFDINGKRHIIHGGIVIVEEI